MDDQEVIEKINRVFEDTFEIEMDRLHPDAHIFTDLGLDSLDIVDLVAALQKSFKVNIRNNEEVRNIRTLEDIYRFIINIKNSKI